jgi:hypothetical protein
MRIDECTNEEENTPLPDADVALDVPVAVAEVCDAEAPALREELCGDRGGMWLLPVVPCGDPLATTPPSSSTIPVETLTSDLALEPAATGPTASECASLQAMGGREEEGKQSNASATYKHH